MRPDHPRPTRSHRLRRRLTATLVPLGAIGLLLGAGAPASAATAGWAQWGPLTGDGGAYASTVQLPAAGFPAATMTSTSRSDAQLPSGATTFLRPATPPGAVYGTSRGSRYVTLRPVQDNPSVPSVTTYTFAAPTPQAGWTFVLGDIDADQVTVSATTPDGAAVAPEVVDRWFQGAFNSTPSGTDVPTWDAATATLTGNALAQDTAGASGWFEPDVSLATLSFTFAARSGFPVYQTWFASRAQEVGGTLTDVSADGTCGVDGAALTLSSPAGQVATATAAADGTYSFGDVAMRSDWAITVTPPAGCAVVGDAAIAVDSTGDEGDDASRGDASLDAVAVAEVAVGGSVVDGDGAPLPSVDVTVTRPDGSTAIDETDADGAWVVPENPVGEGYAVEVELPQGYTPGPDGAVREGLTLTEAGLPPLDFVLIADAVPEPTDPPAPPTDPPTPTDPPSPTDPPTSPPPTAGPAPSDPPTASASPTPPPSRSGGTGGRLPATGADGDALPWAAGLVAAGSALLTVATLRRHRDARRS
ncbi:MSCRAMM family protein [Serinibacter arcticus]|uniref:Cna B domain protein n=1 Tax=Serinibacter arcticus TaxID=1655435 RepID=A0A4Z1DYH4_9MICO|nr:carboxypeptidase-like regulatory domain-containing protein [Serinibacter arcticus]TGO03878.1 Cna B domain protein [Serinibacter arcticus]